MLMVQTVNLRVALLARSKFVNVNYFAGNAEPAVTHNHNLAFTVRITDLNLPFAHAQIAAGHIVKVFRYTVTGNVFKSRFVKWFSFHTNTHFIKNLTLPEIYKYLPAEYCGKDWTDFFCRSAGSNLLH